MVGGGRRHRRVDRHPARTAAAAKRDRPTRRRTSCSPAPITAWNAAWSRTTSAPCHLSTRWVRTYCIAYEMNGAPLPPQHGYPRPSGRSRLVRHGARQMADPDRRGDRTVHRIPEPGELSRPLEPGGDRVYLSPGSSRARCSCRPGSPTSCPGTGSSGPGSGDPRGPGVVGLGRRSPPVEVSVDGGSDLAGSDARARRRAADGRGEGSAALWDARPRRPRDLRPRPRRERSAPAGPAPLEP